MLRIKLLFAFMLVGSVLWPTTSANAVKWSSEVVVSTDMARFEAQPILYSKTSNAYSYRFSWLMPKKGTYSLFINNQIYKSRVSAKGKLETTAWFAPEISYSVQIYSKANGKGSRIAEGIFTVPAPDAPDVDLESESKTFDEYLRNANNYPSSTIKSKSDEKAVKKVFDQVAKQLYKGRSLNGAKPYMSARSIEMMDKLPGSVEFYNKFLTEVKNAKIKNYRPVIYSGKMHATVKYDLKLTDWDAVNAWTMYFIKENDVWKLDLIKVLSQ